MSESLEDKTTKPEDEAKKKLDELLQEGSQKGRLLAETGRDLTQEGQTMADLANATRKVVHLTFHVPNIEGLITQWDANNRQADLTLGAVHQVLLPALISGSSGTLYTSTGLMGRPEIYIDVAPENQAPLSEAITVLSDIVSRPSHRDETLALMKSLGLDVSRPGDKSPLELFNTAHQAFGNPVDDSNPVITSLLPMRESIRLTIDSLLKRRPNQEKAGSERDKILSIGKQLAYNSILPEQIDTWANTWYSELDNDLSPAKQQDVSRDEWQRRLTRATLFLRSFLSGIDPSKLRG